MKKNLPVNGFLHTNMYSGSLILEVFMTIDVVEYLFHGGN